MEIVLPRNIRVFSRESNCFLASNEGISILRTRHLLVHLFDHVHIPDANNEILELLITLDLSVDDRVILNKVLESDNFLVAEALVSTVQLREKRGELEAGLVGALQFWEHVGVSRWVEFILDFVKFEDTRLVSVKVSEGLLNETESNGLQVCNQVIKEKLVLNLTGSIQVIDLKDHSQLSRLHIRYFKVIKSLQEIVLAKLPIALCIE